MKYFNIAVLILVLVGCASDPAQRAAVAEEEVARLAPPVKSLSEFRSYQLNPIVMSPEVMADEDKVEVSKELGAKLNARIMPLLDKWRNHKGMAAGDSDLIIEPKVQRLRVISPGARFWLGAMMGESFIDLDLKLTDSATGQIIASPRVQKSAGAMGGAWSIGATDKNLLDYITDIAHRYLEANYTTRKPDVNKAQ
jgi:hypothetical protein